MFQNSYLKTRQANFIRVGKGPQYWGFLKVFSFIHDVLFEKKNHGGGPDEA